MFENLPDILTVKDMQKALGMGRSKAYKLLNNGDILHMRIGTAIRIPKKFLVDYIDNECYHKRAADVSPVILRREVS